MKKAPLLLLAVALLSQWSHGQVVVTDNGLTPPTIGASDTGNTTTDQRFGWDAGEGFQQTFTVPSAGIIDSIYIRYNGFENGETITLELSVNGSSVATGLVLNGDDFSGNSATDSTTGPFYWMRFDLSAENVAVNAGSNNFALTATADTGDSWALAPCYANGTNPYPGGALTGLGVAGSDLGFAVTLSSTSIVDLAQYDLVDYGTEANRASEVDPANATASAYLPGAGTGFSNATDSQFAPLGTYDPFGTFTVTADSGFELNLASFIFNYAADQQTTAGEAYTINAFVNGILVYTDTVSGTGGNQGFSSGTIDLSGATFQGLSSATVAFTATNPVTVSLANEIRIVGFNTASGYRPVSGRSDMILRGTVDALSVPSAEPKITSFAAVGAGVWEATLEGVASTAYEFRSSTNLDFTPGALVSLSQANPGTDPGTVDGSGDFVTTDGSGLATVQMTLTDNPADFVRAQTTP